MKGRDIHSTEGGFTLVEILVASAVLAIMAALVLGISANAVRFWNRSSSTLHREREVNRAIDRLRSDLETASIPHSKPAWLQFAVEEPVGMGGLHLMFFSKLSQDMPGAITAVSYRLALRDPYRDSASGENTRYGLYRAVLDPEATFRYAMDDAYRSDLKSRFWDSREPAPWENAVHGADILSPYDWSLNTSNLLLSDVVGIQAELEFADRVGNTRVVVLSPEQFHSAHVGSVLVIDGQELEYGRLTAVILHLTVLNRSGAERVSRIQDSHPGYDPGLTLESIAMQYGERSTHRIAISSVGL